MTRCSVLSMWLVLLSGASTACGAGSLPAPRSPETATVAHAPATTLAFSELLVGTTELAASDKAQSLNGQRVRMVGFMAELEQQPRGAFYLTPRPIHGDEAGAGTGDLPVESVLVYVPLVGDRQVPQLEGALEVTGLFETGNRVDEAGFPSGFRIRADTPVSGSVTDPSVTKESRGSSDPGSDDTHR